jgi:single-strand DNA-binding protein
MFDTYITVVGTVLTRPEWRRTTNTNTIVASFRIASNSRRFDKNTEAWVDGPSLRVRVNCWRRLAEGVASSVIVGDPVVVHGRMFTRDWKNDKDELRTSYELEAVTVGHDLSRGRARFERRKPNAVTSAVEDADAEIRVGGEPTEGVDALNATRLDELGEAGFDEFGFDGFGGAAPVDAEFEANEMLRQAGLDGEAAEGEAADGEGEDDGADSDLVGASSGPLGGRGRRRGR